MTIYYLFKRHSGFFFWLICGWEMEYVSSNYQEILDRQSHLQKWGMMSMVLETTTKISMPPTFRFPPSSSTIIKTGDGQ